MWQVSAPDLTKVMPGLACQKRLAATRRGFGHAEPVIGNFQPECHDVGVNWLRSNAMSTHSPADWGALFDPVWLVGQRIK